MGKRTGKEKFNLAMRILFLALFLLECVLLCVESLLPAKASSEQSSAVGGYFDDVISELGGDGIREVTPTAITALCDGKEGEAELDLGTSAQLGVTFNPSNTSVNHRNTVWSSDNEEVASVRGGRVYAVGLGTARLTAQLEEFSFSSSVEITVREVVLEKLSLAFEGGEDAVTLKAGERALLVATTLPKTKVNLRFESSDAEVASVDENGLVCALTEGEATMSAVYTSETPSDDEKVTLTARAKVTVVPCSDSEILPTSLEIGLPASAQGGTLFTGVEDTFTATLLPADCTERRVTWRSSDPEVLAVDAESGAFSALKKGKATVTAYAAGTVAASTSVEVRNETLGATLEADGAEQGEDGAYSLTVTAGRAVPLSVSATPQEYYVRYISEEPDALTVTDAGLLLPTRAIEEVRVRVTVSDDPTFSEEDGALTETLTLLLRIRKQRYSDGVSGFGTFIRKLFGHFGAFLLLGVLAAGVAISFDRGSWKWRLLFLALFLIVGLLFAGLTEILQLDIFTVGRGASLRDVGIDYFGFAPAFLLVYGIYLLIKFFLGLRKKKPPREP